MIIAVITQHCIFVLDFILIAFFHKGIRVAVAASCISIILGSAIIFFCFLAGGWTCIIQKRTSPSYCFFELQPMVRASFSGVIDLLAHMNPKKKTPQSNLHFETCFFFQYFLQTQTPLLLFPGSDGDMKLVQLLLLHC